MSDSTLAVDSTTPAQAREAAIGWLMGRINYERGPSIPYRERQLKLDRMRQLLTRLGRPDAGMKIVHVAGTKGKGSTSAMVAEVLTAAGYRTGLFSSPHLERIEERFAIDGKPCSGDELVALVDRLKPHVRTMDEESAAEGDPHGGPTYFEITTAIALVLFAERRVDAAVLEVGLGGRLDSTNVCLPAVSVITSISFDHTRQLGNTLAAIAREKAGIIKPGVPVVCGVVEAEPQAVIANVAREHGCRLIQAGVDFEFAYCSPRERGERLAGRGPEPGDDALSAGERGADRCDSLGHVDFRYLVAGQELRLDGLRLAMLGRHQGANAATALATIAELRHQGWCISEDAMREGIGRTVLAGRVEFVPGAPHVVLDTAHNRASARAFVEALTELARFERRTLILSISRDKDVHAIVRELVASFERIFVTQYQENPRAVPVERLSEIVREEIEAHRAKRDAAPIELVSCVRPLEAWRVACAGAVPGELICVAGSFFLTAELRPVVLGRVAGETVGTATVW